MDEDDEYGDDIIVLPKTVQCRRYDITVTYDEYRACPRSWLTEYSEDNQPLTKEEVRQDIHSDDADKTVTVEKHPFLLTPDGVHPPV